MDFSLCERIIENISLVIVGKRHAIELLLVAFLADGHALIEDVPGLGKTLMAKSLAKLSWRRLCSPRYWPARLKSWFLEVKGLIEYQRSFFVIEEHETILKCGLTFSIKQDAIT